MMRGVWLTGHGDLDKLELHDNIPVPAPGFREVLIRVSAAAVNNTDVNTRTAWYSKQGSAAEDASWNGAPIHFPRIQGADVCGRIVEVGAYVSSERIGERVLVEPCIREVDGKKLARPWYFGSECDGLGLESFRLHDSGARRVFELGQAYRTRRYLSVDGQDLSA